MSMRVYGLPRMGELLSAASASVTAAIVYLSVGPGRIPAQCFAQDTERSGR